MVAKKRRKKNKIIKLVEVYNHYKTYVYNHYKTYVDVNEDKKVYIF